MKIGTDPEVEHLLDLFQFAHLPQHLQQASAPFARLADKMVSRYEPGWELKAGLRKLLEAKDCMVRQAKADHDVMEAAQDAYDESVGAKPFTDAGRVTVGHDDCFPSHLGGCQHGDADCPRQTEYLADKERLRQKERDLKVGDRATILGIDCIVEEVGPGGRLVGRALTDSEKAAYDEGKWLPSKYTWSEGETMPTTAKRKDGSVVLATPGLSDVMWFEPDAYSPPFMVSEPIWIEYMGYRVNRVTATGRASGVRDEKYDIAAIDAKDVRNLVATPKISPEMLVEQLRAVGSPYNSIVRTGEPGEMPWLNKAVISGEFNFIELAEILNNVVAKQVRSIDSKEAP